MIKFKPETCFVNLADLFRQILKRWWWKRFANTKYLAWNSARRGSSRLVKVNFRNPLGSGANVPSISVSGRRKFLSRLTANLLLRKGYRCAARLLSAPRTRFLRFQPREETLNTLIYRRSYDGTFIGQLFFFTRFLDFEIRWKWRIACADIFQRRFSLLILATRCHHLSLLL